jgi:hypothetical protein
VADRPKQIALVLVLFPHFLHEDTKASFNGAPITQEWKYLMGDGNIFAVSYVWTIHTPDAPLEITGMVI